MKCTYVGCDKEAKHPQIAKDGEHWANLCEEHEAEMNSFIANHDPKSIISSWIKAQGGPKKAADRLVGEK